MKKLKFPLKFLLIGFGAVIIIATVIALIFGFNSSVEFGGGKRLTINVTGSLEVDKIRSQAENVLSNGGLIVESSYVEDNAGETNLVFVTKNNKSANYDQIRVLIATKTGVSTTEISEFKTISSSLNSSLIIRYAIALVLGVVVIGALGIIRYKFSGAITLALTALASLLFNFALIALTRVPLSTAVLLTTVFGVILSLTAAVVVIENAHAKFKTKAYSELSETEIVSVAANEAVLPLSLLAGFIGVFALILICLPQVPVKMIGLGLVLALLSSAFVGYFTSTGLYSLLYEVGVIRKKTKLSKNPKVNKRIKK